MDQFVTPIETPEKQPVVKRPIGSPMGIKVNDESLVNGLTLDALILLTQCYHGGKYVIGHDSLYVEKPHYHIHWLSVKESSEGALKTFRSNSIKKKFPDLAKSFRIYYAKDIPSADPMYWISYALKETVVTLRGYEMTEQMRIDCKSHLEIKRLKSIKSEKLANDQKEKRDFKDKMYAYVTMNLPDIHHVCGEYYCKEYEAFCVTVIEYLASVEKYGSMKLTFLRQYYIEYKLKYCPDKWSAVDVFKFISR